MAAPSRSALIAADIPCFTEFFPASDLPLSGESPATQEKLHPIYQQLKEEYIMKSKTLAAFTMIIGIALSTSAYAQGRHDEKPHGQGKPAATAKDKAGNPPLPGRHDERPHGTTKSTAKKDGAKAAEGVDKGAK